MSEGLKIISKKYLKCLKFGVPKVMIAFLYDTLCILSVP